MSGGKKAARTAGRYISEFPGGTPTPHPTPAGPTSFSSRNPSSTPRPAAAGEASGCLERKTHLPLCPLSDALAFGGFAEFHSYLVTRPFWASGQPREGPEGLLSVLAPSGWSGCLLPFM